MGDGLYPESGQSTVTINVGTSGHYQDRYQSKQFNFASTAFNKRFEYFVNNPDATQHDIQLGTGSSLQGTVAVDASAAPGQGNEYFIPTPFANWNISLQGLMELFVIWLSRVLGLLSKLQ